MYLRSASVGAEPTSTGCRAPCKKILSFKSVLSRLLKTCVDEFKDVSLKDIEEKYIIGTPEISTTPVHRDENAPKVRKL